MSESPYTKMTREEIAEMEIGKTTVSRAMANWLVAAFLLTILSVPVAQHYLEVRAGFEAKGRWVWPKAYDALSFPGNAARAFDDPAHQGLWNKIQAANASFMRDVKAYEKALEDDSFVARASLPHTQALTAEFLGLGNEQVFLGRDGWLFYQPEVGYLTGDGFLRPSVLSARAHSGRGGEVVVQPDPVKAIADFNNQLRERGIHLILMPAPVKPMIEPERLSARFHDPLPIPLQNPSYPQFLAKLQAAGVDVLDVAPALAKAKFGSRQPQFLRADTHWMPEAMELAAGLLAEKVRALDLLTPAELPLTRSTQDVANAGDIAGMLKLPPSSKLYPPQSVSIHPVWNGGAPFASDPQARILVLGDSFSNIYSLAPMGWGASAGLVEQLGYFLRQPVDAILRNDAGAFATRELLAKELAQGRDRLAGKKIVVWEFAMRELAVGDWKMIPVNPRSIPVLAPTGGGAFYCPADGSAPVRVTGVVRSASKVPRPGTVPYKDHVFAVHLADISGPGIPSGGQALVYLFGMKDNKLTPAAGWKAGDRVALELRSWNDVAAKYDRLNRSEPDDENLQLESPAWGEPVK